MSLDMNPELPPGWDLTKVIPGELEVPDDLSGELDDDIAPGVMLPYEPAYPVLRKTGSAAMVVASVTGRAIGLSARGGWTATRWFVAGAAAVSYLGWRYVRTHDYQEAVGGITSSADWRRNVDQRHRRWKFLGWGAGATLALNLAGWWALVAEAGMTAADSWWITPGVLALSVAAAVSWYGRYRLNNPGLAPEQIIAEQDDPESDVPFPLAVAQSPGQVAECVSRALAFKGVSTRDVSVTQFCGWGWELDVTLDGSKAADVSRVLDDLDAIFDIPQGGTMFEPDPRRSARIVMRLVQNDPFANMARPAIHAPRSLSVHDRIIMGQAMDGTPFELTLDGFFALIIGGMGAGKTLGALRTLAEAITACVDAVCWDLDPMKNGLAEFGDLMELRARDPEACEKALERALKYVTARGKVSARQGWDRWKASAKHPHLYIFIDEFLQLSDKGKKLAIQILRTGRQYGIYLIFAGQEATEDALGDAIASIVAYRIGMACRFEDLRLLFGTGKSGLGWRPDRLEPAVNDEIVNDAGQSFIMGGAFNRAIRYRFNGFTRDQISEAVPARIKAGVNRMDSDTLLEAGESLAQSEDRLSLADRVEAFAEETGKDDARTIANLLFLYEAKKADWLATSLIVEAGVVDDGTQLQALLSALVPGAASTRRWEESGRPRGWDREVAERAASALIAPV